MRPVVKALLLAFLVSILLWLRQHLRRCRDKRLIWWLQHPPLAPIECNGTAECEMAESDRSIREASQPLPFTKTNSPSEGRHGHAAATPSSYESVVDNRSGRKLSGLFRTTGRFSELQQKYDLSQSTHLGNGCTGSVCTVRRRDTRDLFAMKTVRVTSSSTEGFDELQQEVAIQRRLDHPNICKVLESFEDPEQGKLFIIMELCTGGTLVSRMKQHGLAAGEAMVATVIEKMLSAVRYCHMRGVVHRDIKLDNIVYEGPGDEAEPKLIDFGFACRVRGRWPRPSRLCGRPLRRPVGSVWPPVSQALPSRDAPLAGRAWLGRHA